MSKSTFSRHRLPIGLGFFSLAAVADIRMTLEGIQGQLELEGNPVMHAFMTMVGPEAGLWIGKAMVGLLCFLVAKYGEREIRRGADWITKVPSTPSARAWMRRGDSSWIAYILSIVKTPSRPKSLTIPARLP